MRIASHVVRTVVDHARASAPRECCGILLGADDVILDAAPTANLAESETRFLIDPKGHIDARRAARDGGLDVVGFYHSHPTSAAVPSPTDLAEASYRDAVYLIVSLATESADVGLFRLSEAGFVEVELIVEST